MEEIGKHTDNSVKKRRGNDKIALVALNSECKNIDCTNEKRKLITSWGERRKWKRKGGSIRESPIERREEGVERGESLFWWQSRHLWSWQPVRAISPVLWLGEGSIWGEALRDWGITSVPKLGKARERLLGVSHSNVDLPSQMFTLLLWRNFY